MIIAISIIADRRFVAHTKRFTSLLTNLHSFNKSSRTITLGELIRICISFDRRTKLLSGIKAQVLDIVRIKSGRLCTRRALCYSGKTIPGYTFAVDARGRNVKNTIFDTGLIKMFTGLVPFNFHLFVLLLIINCKNVMIKIIRRIESIKSTIR